MTKKKKKEFSQAVFLYFYLTPTFKVFLLACYLFMQILSHTAQNSSE